MAKIFDIAIIGAGPAGLCAAKNIISQNTAVSLALIEKSSGKNKKIPCGEGIGKRGFHEMMEPRKSWIHHTVSSAAFHSPDNTIITYNDKNQGYILNRSLMEQDLTEECLNSGAIGLMNHTAIDISPSDIKGLRTITFKNNNPIQSRVVIDCSGPQTRFGHSENITIVCQDMDVAYFAHVNGVPHDPNIVHMYVGKDFAPGGYAWAFPRFDNCMNIGVVLGSSMRSQYKIRNLLNVFIQKYFPKSTITSTCAGIIPCYTQKSAIAVPGLIKAGDTISTVNPISRAGITEAMKSGHMAGNYALKMVSASTEKDFVRLCTNYEKEWHKKLGKSHIKLAKVKRSLLKVTDEEYNKGAHALSQIPPDQVSMSKIFTTCLGKFPKLVLELRHLM